MGLDTPGTPDEHGERPRRSVGASSGRGAVVMLCHASMVRAPRKQDVCPFYEDVKNLGAPGAAGDFLPRTPPIPYASYVFRNMGGGF